MWTSVGSHFEGETVNFGPRNEQMGASQLYETSTVLTISAGDHDIQKDPLVHCSVSGSHLAIAVDSVVHVFDQQYRTLCTLPFETNVATILLLSEMDILFVGDSSFHLHVVNMHEAKITHKVPVCASENSSETASFQGLDVTQIGEDEYILCLLVKNSLLIFSKFSLSSLNETQENGELLKFISVDVAHNTNWKVPLGFESTFCASNEQFLVTGERGALFAIPGEHNGSPYCLFAEFPGGEIMKMTCIQHGRSLVLLNSEGDVFTICLKTFLITNAWVGRKVQDFVLIENDDCGKYAGTSQIGILTRPMEGVPRKLEIYSYPSLDLLYTLVVNNFCLLATLSGTKEEFCLIEGVSDNEKNVVNELRIRLVCESLPEIRLATLMKKQKFSEAEEFALLFGIPVEEVHWQHFFYLLEKLGPYSSGTDEVEQVAPIDSIACLIQKLPDKLRAAQCCIDAVPANPSFARQLFEFLQEHASTLSNLSNTKYDSLHAEISSILNRVATFELMHADDSKWLTFLKADFLEAMCMLFNAENISRALLVWMRHCDQMNLTRESVCRILNSIPVTMTAAQIIDWFSGGFLSSVLCWAHDAMEDICQWTINKVVMMEVGEKSAWPSSALQLLNVIPEFYEELRSNPTLMTVQSWIAVHSIPRLVTTKNSPFYRLYHLLADLRSLEVLWNKHQCYLSLQELQNPDQQEVIFSILDCITTHGAVSKVIQDFLLPYLKTRNQDASEVLSAYVDEILISSPFTWWHWESAPWEDKVTAVTKFITSPNTLLECIDKILAQAPVPWSKGIEALASEAPALGSEAYKQVSAQRRVMRVKLILRNYNMRNFNCMVLSDMTTIIRNILLSGKPTSLEDALEVVKNIQIVTQDDVYMWHLQSAFLSSNVDSFADSFQSLPESIIDKVGPRLANFGWLYLSRYHDIYSPKMDGIAESCIYLLNTLHERTADEIFGKRRDQLRQMHRLHKEFDIKDHPSDVAFVQARHAVLEKSFKNFINAQNNECAEMLCKKLLAVGNTLKLDRQATIETLIPSALKVRQYNVARILFRTLLNGNKVGASIVSLLKEMFCTCEDVLTLASDLHCCASQVLSVAPRDAIKESIEICQWADFLLQVHNASLPDKMSGTADLYLTWGLSYMYEAQGFVLEKCSTENTIRALARVIWLPPMDTDELHTIFTEAFTGVHSQLSQKAQTEMCLQLCSVANQHNARDIASQQLECEISRHEKEALKAMVMRATTQKHIDFVFVAGLFNGLPPSEALNLMKGLILQSGANYRLLKALAAIGSKVSVANGVPQVKHKFDDLFRKAFWGHRLAAFGISFKSALKSPDAATLDSVMGEMTVAPAVDITTIQDYCREYKLCFDDAMVKRVVYLIKQAEDLYSKGEDITNTLEKTHEVLQLLPREQAVKTLRKLLAKMNPYCYEILSFGYRHMAGTEGQETVINVDRELSVLDFLASYRRHAKPTTAEMDAWFNDHPESEELPAVSERRLPFQRLLQKLPWKYINDEIYPETVTSWLSIADSLELDCTKIRFLATVNAVTLWSSRKANCSVLDTKLLSTIQGLIREIPDVDTALACATAVLNTLPDGPTRTKAAEMSSTLALRYSQLETPAPAAHKSYVTFNKHYMKSKIKQVLSHRGLDTPEHTALASRPEDLIHKLLENIHWCRLFSDTKTIYECIEDVARQYNSTTQDLYDIFTKKVESWLNCCLTTDITLDQSMTLNFDIGQDRSEEQAGLTSCIHLMQHFPQSESKKMLGDIIRNANSYFGLQQEVSGMQCALASFSEDDCEDMFGLTFSTAMARLQCISYKVRLQDLGIPLPLEELDKTKATELASNIISSRGQHPKALHLAFLLCTEFDVDAVQLWNSLLGNTMVLSTVELITASVLALGRVPTMWHRKTFQDAWKAVLKTQTLQERCSLLLRCSALHALPLGAFVEESRCKDSILFALVCTVLSAKGRYGEALDTFLSSLPQTLLAELSLSKEMNSWLFLQLPQVQRALSSVPS